MSGSSTECSQKFLGKVSNAGSSFAGRSRKPEVERPLSTVHKRVTIAKQTVILEGTPDGWTAITQQGVFTNPWKGRPYSSITSCCKSVAYRLRRGHWPKKLERQLAKAQISSPIDSRSIETSPQKSGATL
jgi:hypothetical protein